MVAWRKEDGRQKKAKVRKAERPACPERNPAYPSKEECVLSMLREFRHYHPHVKIKAVLADALYGNRPFMDEASSLCGNVQVISQLRCNQNLRFRNRELPLPAFFARYPGVPQTIRIRGGEPVEVMVSSARVHVIAHGKKRFVIALKYAGEDECRYLVTTDLSWRTLDIVQAHTLRWLVEVFLEDWKLYKGWGHLAKQPDEEGSSRCLTLSLLCDHALILRPEQLTRLEDKQPACSVGSLHCKSEAFLDCIRQIPKLNPTSTTQTTIPFSMAHIHVPTHRFCFNRYPIHPIPRHTVIATGICVGMANLIVYFIPALDLSATLVPAAILTTVTIITLGSAFKLWVAEDVRRSLDRYYEEDDVEDDEPPELPPVTGHRKGKYRVN